jgi:hypothetical protein
MGAPTISGASELKAHKSAKHARYHPGQSPKQSRNNGSFADSLGASSSLCLSGAGGQLRPRRRAPA